MTETSDDGFTVGYKKPPQHSRFRPGRSGNPRGKQKGVRNLGSDVKRTLEVPVRLNEQGRARRGSTERALLLPLKGKGRNADARYLSPCGSCVLLDRAPAGKQGSHLSA